ncbi:MAG: signal peptide peptidase SppA [Pirellulales bacterium]|nr:signal peptide peptidase SppA [Pirellulales bacterium]
MSIVVNPDGNASNQPVRIVLEQGGFLGRFGSRLPWILFLIALIAAISIYSSYKDYLQSDPKIRERLFSGNVASANKIAVIRVEGTIMHDDGFPKWQIDKVREDKSVKAVVLRIDSPGGTVTGSDYLYHHLKRLREGSDDRDGVPMVVSMGGIAASGGYYIAMAAGATPDTIFAERSTWTGSVGVIIPHYNVADLLENWKIQDDSVVSGKFKALGSPTRKLSPELAEKERELLQGLVDQTFDQFKDIVKESRPKVVDANGTIHAEITTGRIFTAKQALELGLVDKIGYLEEAIDRAMELANLDKSNTRVVNYSPPATLLGSMFGSSAQSGHWNLAALLDSLAPRAYYLCSWLPPVVANQAK